MKGRMDNQKSIDDFIKPLLTGEVLEMFSKMQGSKDFKSRVLPINFNEGGHQEYVDKWRFLFMYETYNILINSRRQNSKEEDHAAEQNKMRGFQTRTKHMSWTGYVVCGVKDEF